MDLSQLDTVTAADRGATLTIIHPRTGEPITNDDGTVWTIELVGTDSAEYQATQKRLTTNRLSRSAGNARSALDAASLEADGIKLLASATRGWTGLQENGAPIPFSPVKAVDLYTRFPWLREQVSAFVNDRANFLGE